jgi:hypothetical protein
VYLIPMETMSLCFPARKLKLDSFLSVILSLSNSTQVLLCKCS